MNNNFIVIYLLSTDVYENVEVAYRCPCSHTELNFSLTSLVRGWATCDRKGSQ